MKLYESENKPELTNRQKKILNILKNVEDGEIDYDYLGHAVGGVLKFIDLLDKENLINYLDPMNVVWSDYENYLLYKKVESDSSYIWEVISNLSDITKIGDMLYFDTDGEELSELFETYRGDISQNTIEEIINGEHDMNLWDTTDDEYRDVYLELTPENKKLVDDRIRKDLIMEETLRAATSLLQEIAEEQGRETVMLDDEIITRILDDEDTMVFLINKELDDVRHDLYSIHSSCYSGILSDEWYDDIMSELTGEVIDNSTFEEYKYTKNIHNKNSGRHEPRTVYSRRYPAKECVFHLVREWIYENKESTYNDDSISYHGSYFQLMKSAMDNGMRSKLRTPNLDSYPDYNQMTKCINGFIDEYF
jgi:hypothetical protein